MLFGERNHQIQQHRQTLLLYKRRKMIPDGSLGNRKELRAKRKVNIWVFKKHTYNNNNLCVFNVSGVLKT